MSSATIQSLSKTMPAPRKAYSRRIRPLLVDSALRTATSLSRPLLSLNRQTVAKPGKGNVRQSCSAMSEGYWRSLEAIEIWRQHPGHGGAKQLGRQWFSHCMTRIARVERDYGFDNTQTPIA